MYLLANHKLHTQHHHHLYTRFMFLSKHNASLGFCASKNQSKTKIAINLLHIGRMLEVGRLVGTNIARLTSMLI